MLACYKRVRYAREVRERDTWTYGERIGSTLSLLSRSFACLRVVSGAVHLYHSPSHSQALDARVCARAFTRRRLCSWLLAFIPLCASDGRYGTCLDSGFFFENGRGGHDGTVRHPPIIIRAAAAAYVSRKRKEGSQEPAWSWLVRRCRSARNWCVGVCLSIVAQDARYMCMHACIH